MALSASDESRLTAELQAAEAATLAGRLGEARSVLRRALDTYPERADVLAASGLFCLRTQAFAEAVPLLESAAQRTPDDPRLLVNLASCFRGLGDAQRELEALQRALKSDPYFSIAIFQKAFLLERLGKTRAAARAFHAALSSLRPDDRLPADWKPMIEEAQAKVRANGEALERAIAERLAPVREKFATAALDRVDDCILGYLGRRRVYVQQPLFTHFPRLPAIEYYPRSDFPWLAALEEETDAIRAELKSLLVTARGDFVPYLEHAPDAPLNQWRELNGSLRWGALFLYKEGRRIEANAARCPATVAALARVPQVVIKDRAPTAFFSRLDPHTRIPPHTGVSNTRLTVHLPLIVPPGCRFRVGAEVRQWQEGVAFVFDDTIEHEAWNDSGEERVVLIFDIWNPLLTEAERAMTTAMTEGIAEYYADAEDLTWS